MAMRQWMVRVCWVGVLVLTACGGGGSSGSAAGQSGTSTPQPVATAASNLTGDAQWQLVHDYMVQDVCVDAQSQVLPDVSPLSPSCTAHRDLRVGEALPYHKHDWPGDVDAASAQQGYQRSDSFPAQLPNFGEVITQSFDFGGSGRNFGTLDAGDGGQLIAFSSAFAGILATQDGGNGLQFMAGPTCLTGGVTPQRLLDSWQLSSRVANQETGGNTVANLKIVTEPQCPNSFDSSFTEWSFQSLRYRLDQTGHQSVPLKTMVSGHYGGADVASADHLERFYFTRELGLTRWERWQQLPQEPVKRQEVLATAAWFASTGRCENQLAPPTAQYVLVDCRQWSNIQKGDPPSASNLPFWVSDIAKFF